MFNLFSTRKIEKLDFEIAIIPQTLNIYNYEYSLSTLISLESLLNTLKKWFL